MSRIANIASSPIAGTVVLRRLEWNLRNPCWTMYHCDGRSKIACLSCIAFTAL